MKRVVCLWLPHWPLQRWRAAHKHLESTLDAARRRSPWVVLYGPAFDPSTRAAGGARARGERVVACSQAAWKCGVRLGMPLAEAQALVRHEAAQTAAAASEPHFERHAPEADWEALRRLAEQCERFSPLVGWETLAGAPRWGLHPPTPQASSQKPSPQKHVLSPQHLLLDVTGIGRLFGGEERLVEELRAALHDEGYVAQGAVAGTAGMAWACAEASWPIIPSDRVNSMPQLANRSVERLRLPPATVELLRQLGIERVGQVLELPREALAARFGPGLLRRLDQLHEEEAEWIEPHRAAPLLQVQRCLDEPVRQRAWVEQIVEEMLSELGEQLRPSGSGALELQGRLDCSRDMEDGRDTEEGRDVKDGRAAEERGGGASRARTAVVELRVGLFRPSACPRHWSSLLRMQLERLELPGAVGRIGLGVTTTARLQERQGALFERAGEGDERCIGNLLERLGSRLGANAVLRPVLVSAALPEHAYRYESALGAARHLAARENVADFAADFAAPNVAKRSGKRAGKRSEKAAEWRDASRAGVVGEREGLQSAGYRPLELLHPPRPLEVVAVALEGPPQSFCWERQWQRVTGFSGPERIETGWWRGDSVRRDYYRVESATGVRFWLFRDLSTSQWFLHGLFG